MAASPDTSDMEQALEHSLQGAIRSSFPDGKRRATPTVSESTEQLRTPEALPRCISGGFNALAADIDRRSRDSGMMVRLLEQQRTHLATAEAERDRLYEELSRAVPEATESGRSLAQMVETAKAGDLTGDLSKEFGRSLRALDELENVARALSANLLWTRSSWEQYARSVIAAQKIRDEPAV